MIDLLESSAWTHGQRAHLEIAVGVEQQVGRLEVSVDHICRVESLERAEGLVDEVLLERDNGEE